MFSKCVLLRNPGNKAIIPCGLMICPLKSRLRTAEDCKKSVKYSKKSGETGKDPGVERDKLKLTISLKAEWVNKSMMFCQSVIAQLVQFCRSNPRFVKGPCFCTTDKLFKTC